MAKRRARTVRHPSERPLLRKPTVKVGAISETRLSEVKPTPTRVPAIKLAKAKSVPPPDAKWYTETDATKVGEYLVGKRKLDFNELQKYDINRDGKVTAVDGMFVRQYIAGKVIRGPSGYAKTDASIVALHMAGQIMIPPELIGFYDANGDGKVDISDAMRIAQAIAKPPVEVPDVRPPMPTKELSPNETYVWDDKLKAWLVMARQGITPIPGIDPSVRPHIVGGGGWALLRNPETGEEGWIQYGIGTQYRYGGKEWDDMYKGWEVVSKGRDMKPPKGAEYLPSGYPAYTKGEGEAVVIKPPMPTKKLATNEKYVWDDKSNTWLVEAKQGTPIGGTIAPIPLYPDFDPRPPKPITEPKEGYVWAKAGYFVLGINPDTGSPYMGGRRGQNEPIPEYKWMQVPKKFADKDDAGIWEYDNMKWWKLANKGGGSTGVGSDIKPSGMVTSSGTAKVTKTKTKTKAKAKKKTAPKVSSVWL